LAGLACAAYLNHTARLHNLNFDLLTTNLLPLLCGLQLVGKISFSADAVDFLVEHGLGMGREGEGTVETDTE
jgi:hypothetical protein